MKDAWLLLGVLALWIVLNRWILPSLGIQTCMSGACMMDRCSSQECTVSDSAEKNLVEQEKEEHRP